MLECVLCMYKVLGSIPSISIMIGEISLILRMKSYTVSQTIYTGIAKQVSAWGIRAYVIQITLIYYLILETVSITLPPAAIKCSPTHQLR